MKNRTKDKIMVLGGMLLLLFFLVYMIVAFSYVFAEATPIKQLNATYINSSMEKGEIIEVTENHIVIEYQNYYEVIDNFGEHSFLGKNFVDKEEGE